MKNSLFKVSTVLLVLCASLAFAAANTVPEPFRGHDPNSTFKIKYGDVDAILKTMVVDVGRSLREKAEESRAKTGTRMKTKVKVDTAKEGNRFFFEEFQKNDEYKQILHNVRLSLEAIPDQVPLEAFNRKEQLAYWLNLYNITVLDQLVQIYPERNLKKEVVGRKSIFDDKILNVAGVPLSLDDIQYTILAGNYDNDPLIMYGLYKGIIGAPNIRRTAYTAENVTRLLQDNAENFINANRGTQAQDGKFEVSSLYDRNRQYFPDFDEDLKQHLMRYIEGPERVALQSTTRIVPNIDDWTITDVYGTMNTIGGSFSDSKAAMIDAVTTQQPGPDGGASPPISASFSGASSRVQAKTPDGSRFSPDVLTHLTEIKEMEERSNLSKQGTVTVEEMGEASAQESQPEEEPDSDQ